MTLDYRVIVYMATKEVTAPASVGRKLVFAAATGKAVCGRLLEPHGLSLAQWAVLSSIWRNGELGVKALAVLTGNAPPATSRLVDRMVESGLLVRRPDVHDRRAVVVGLGEKGEALRPLQDVFEEVNAILLADLVPQERADLMRLLERVERSGRAWLAGR